MFASLKVHMCSLRSQLEGSYIGDSLYSKGSWGFKAKEQGGGASGWKVTRKSL